MMSKTTKNTGGVSVQEELLPLKSGVPAGVTMLPHHTIHLKTVLCPDHNCAGNAPVPRAQASRVDWLQQVVPTILKVDAKTTSKAIVDAVNLHFGNTITV
jgi:hypothetical protein